MATVIEATNGAAAPGAVQNGATEESDFKLRFCTVCASNQNR